MEHLIIDRLGHQGDGIAAGPVYVPGALPGEEVEGAVTDGVMATPRILTPSSDRVRPPCRHAKSCGGCQLQHASDAFLADWKVEVVRTALAAQGLSAPFRPIAVSPAQSRRRATFSARRTKKGGLAGFHMKASDVIVSVPDCQLVRPQIAAALPLAEELAVLAASRKGELSVLMTRSADGLDLSVTGGKPLDAPLSAALADLARKYDLARIGWDGDFAITRRPPRQIMGRAEVVAPPGAFLQATPEGEAALLDAVREAVGEAGRIVDLFAGCGTFALPLADAARVHAVEGSAPMLTALDHGARNAQGLKPLSTETRDLFRNPLLAEELSRYDAVVIDPPRAGAEAQIAQIAKARVPRIAHVSCNPVTFARDCAALVSAGYRIDWVQVVDQFRWSTHVEMAAQLRVEGQA